jgi:hypothetical protein
MRKKHNVTSPNCQSDRIGSVPTQILVDSHERGTQGDSIIISVVLRAHELAKSSRVPDRKVK